jgi:hypothetical protein
VLLAVLCRRQAAGPRGPDSDRVDTVAGQIVAVMFTKKAEGDAFAAFEGTAKTIEDVEFGVAPVLKGRKEGDIVMYKEAEPKESVFAGATTKEELKKCAACPPRALRASACTVTMHRSGARTVLPAERCSPPDAESPWPPAPPRGARVPSLSCELRAGGWRSTAWGT